MYSKDIIDTLIKHSEMYPLIDIQDLIKLIYQFSLGPNHLLNNVDLNNIKKQMLLEASKSNISNKEIVYIGNDLYRVSLFNDNQYLEEVYNAFIKTCNEFTDKDIHSLIENLKLSVNYLSYFKNIYKDEYQNFLNKYINNGCKSISHSEIYKKNYKPCYRLVHKKYLNNL